MSDLSAVFRYGDCYYEYSQPVSHENNFRNFIPGLMELRAKFGRLLYYIYLFAWYIDNPVFI